MQQESSLPVAWSATAATRSGIPPQLEAQDCRGQEKTVGRGFLNELKYKIGAAEPEPVERVSHLSVNAIEDDEGTDQHS